VKLLTTPFMKEKVANLGKKMVEKGGRIPSPEEVGGTILKRKTKSEKGKKGELS